METSSEKTAKPLFRAPALEGSYYLHHVLSPLELAAKAARFGAFTYSFNGLPLHISGAVAANLRHIYELRLLLCEQFAGQALALMEEAGPGYAPFLCRPLGELGLPARLHNLLLSADCETLLDVARLGPRGLSCKRGMGIKSLALLREFFVREGYEELFR